MHETEPGEDSGALPRRAYLGRGFDPAHQFQDAALRWVGILALLCAVAPVTFSLGVPRFLWHLLPDEEPGTWAALLAFPLAGLALLVLARIRCSKAAKGFWALGALLFATLLAPLSREVTEGLWNGLPGHFWHHALLYLGAFALLAASSRLAAASEARGPWHPVGHGIALAGTVLLALFYVLPQRAEIPIVETVRNLGVDLSDLPARLQIGLWANRLIILAPIAALVVSAISVIRRRPMAPAVLFAFFVGVLPVLCFVTGARVALVGSGLAFLLHLRNAVVLGGAVLVGAAALCAIYTQLFVDPPEEGGQPSPLWRDRLLASVQEAAPPAGHLPGQGGLAAGALARGRQANLFLRWLATRRASELLAERAQHGDPDEPVRDYFLRRLSGAGPAEKAPAEPFSSWPSSRWAQGYRLPVAVTLLAALLVTGRVALAPSWEKGALWELHPPDPAAQRLLARTLPRYVVALWNNRSAATGTSERLQEARRALLEAAAPFPDLAESLGGFADLAESGGYRPKSMVRWIRAIDASLHAAALPYVVEPVVWTQREGGEPDPRRPWRESAVSLSPRVALKVFRVERLRRFDRDGAPFTAAWVERLDRLNLGEAHLGRSVRQSPYALVLADEAREYAQRSLQPVLEDPPRLGEGWRGVSEELGAEILALLSSSLAGLLPPSATREEGGAVLSRLVAESTERHELEHEADRGDSVPSALYRRMSFYQDAAVRRTAGELRAYLAQMATPAGPVPSAAPGVVLARMLLFACGRGAAATAERFASRLITERMGEALGVALKPREDLEPLALEIARRAVAEPGLVPEKAARVYEDLFGEAVTRFTLVEERNALPALQSRSSQLTK